MTRFWLDSPVDGVAVTLFGGIQKTGLSNGLLIIYPADEPPSQYPSFISDGIRYACYVFSVIGIICAIVLSVLTFVYFENPYFKKASPYFLYLYNLGATIIFIGLILFNVGGLNLAACSAAVWMVSTGCIILYAPIVVKNYRIYRIFTARYRITGLDNSKLLSVVGVCVLLNCIPLVLFQTVGGGFVAQSLTIGSEVWPVCSSNAGLWIWILIAPMIALLLFGLFLSFQTRHVFSAYNESQLINISVYLTILSMLILVPLALTINLPPTHHLLLTLVGSFTVISILGINFGPKLINIWFGGDQMVEMSKHSEKSKESEDYSDAIFCRSCMRPMDNEKESQASVSAKKSGFATDKMSSNVKSIQKSKSTTEEA